jgi:hypothetical protein
MKQEYLSIKSKETDRLENMQIERELNCSNLQQFGNREEGKVYRPPKMVGIDGDDDGRWGAPCFTGPDINVELKRDSFSGCNVSPPPPVPGNLLSTFKCSMLHVRHARRLQGRL